MWSVIHYQSLTPVPGFSSRSPSLPFLFRKVNGKSLKLGVQAWSWPVLSLATACSLLAERGSRAEREPLSHVPSMSLSLNSYYTLLHLQ